jgi:pyocin large subunit-like protein
VGMGYGKVSVWAVVGGAALLALSACDRGPASIPARDHSAALGGSSSATSVGSSGGSDRADADLRVATTREDPRTAPVPMVDGKPMWAANRRHTAEENAQYQFARDGADFGARNVDDYVAKAHAFVDRPPSGVLSLTRNNGDRLLYDPRANVFAVVSSEGAPRTMFKPRDGQAYWAEQKQRLAEEASSGGDGDSNGGERHYGGYRSHEHRSGGGDDDQG